MTVNNSHRDDLEPLIKSTEATSSRNNQWRFNKKFRILGKTKEAQECGRLRLGVILCGFTFLLIYLTNLKPYPHMMVVKIPEDDDNLPGPKGELYTSNASRTPQSELKFRARVRHQLSNQS